MIIRILLLLAAIYLMWRVLRHMQARFNADARKSGATGAGGLRVKSVRCAHCGLFLPEADALAHGGRHYCSPEHREAMRDNGESS